MHICIIIFLASTLYGTEFNFNSSSIHVYNDGEELTHPFTGGLNKPRIQWIDWDQDSLDDLFILDEDGYIRYLHNVSEGENIRFEVVSANYFNTNHQEIIINQKEYFEDLDKMIYHLDEPYGGGLPFWHIFKKAAKN